VNINGFTVSQMLSDGLSTHVHFVQVSCIQNKPSRFFTPAWLALQHACPL